MPLLRALLIAGIVLSMMCCVPVVQAQHRIRIGEGTLEDWDGVATPIVDAANDVPGNHNDFHRLWVTHDEEYLYARFDGDFSKNHNMAIHLVLEDPESGTILAQASVIKRRAYITLEISNQPVSDGLVEYFAKGSGRETDTIHAAWPLQQLGLTADRAVMLWAESHASHAPNSAVKDRVPDLPLKIIYDLTTGTWRPHQPGDASQHRFVTRFVVISEMGHPTGAAGRGEIITYVLTVENAGALPIQPSVLSPVPNGTVYVAGSARLAMGEGEPIPVDDVEPGESPLARGMTLPEIAPGEKASVSFRVIVDSANAIGFEIVGAAVVSDGFQRDELQTVTTVLAPHIEVLTATDVRSVVPGDSLTFEITIVNKSAVAARNVQVVSPVPPGMSYISHSVTAPVGATVRFQDAKTGDWLKSEPEEVAAVEWVLEVVKATSEENVSMQLLTH